MLPRLQETNTYSITSKQLTMLALTPWRSLRRSSSGISSPASIPLAFASARTFTTSPPVLSHIGREEINVPPEVKLVERPARAVRANRRIQPLRTLYELPSIRLRNSSPANYPPLHNRKITGPFGNFALPLPHYLTISLSDTVPIKATVSVENENDKIQHAMWGTTRAILASKILGVSERHSAILRLNGVGYRAVLEQGGSVVNLKVGYAHRVDLAVPEGVKVTIPTPTRILLEGEDKEVVTNFAAKLRRWRKPEP